jgi:hypothetical protein
MHENSDTKEIQASQSEMPYVKPKERVTSENLLKHVCLQLHESMTKVVAEKVTPDNVKAACLCAGEIYKLLKLNLEIEKQSKGR